jgi:galactose-1-phosphate uridylyltransferase
VSRQSEQKLSLAAARELDAPERLHELSWQSAIALLERQPGIGKALPDGIYGIDPRNREPTFFNSRRAHRPHDNVNREPTDSSSCAICRGSTTAIIDRAELSDGFTFINENLYPVVYPRPASETPLGVSHLEELTGRAVGLHFIQWTSSYHDRDWPELPQHDRRTVLDRLAALERRLLELPGYPCEERFVSIIKNSGSLVGGSLSHPHQQIVLSNVAPRRVRENHDVLRRRGVTFAELMLQGNPSDLTIMSLETGRFVVPYFMRRPYNLLYIPERVDPSYLWETNSAEREDLARALAVGMQLTESGLRFLEREQAFNVAFHTGPGAGIYLEFLPRSQEEGGFERLGLSACQASPFEAARRLRQVEVSK